MFHRLKVGQRLLLMVAIPLAGLLAFAGYNLWQKIAARSEALTTGRIVEFSVRTSALLHETQRERGRSSVFLNDHADQSLAAVREQRKATDVRLQEFEAFVAKFDARRMDGELTDDIGRIRGTLGELTSMRSRVDAQSVPPAEAVAFYTTLNSQLLDVIAVAGNQTTDGIAAAHLNAYHSLLSAKECAGIERAVLSGSYARGNFGGLENYRKLVGLAAKQTTELDAYQTFFGRNEKLSVDGFSKRPEVQEADALRKASLALPPDAALTGHTGPECFGIFTKRIDAMKELEDLVAEELAGDAKANAATATFWLLLTFAFTAASLVFTVWFSRVTASGVVKPIEHVRDELADIAHGDGDLTKRLHVNSTDELGALAQAFNEFISKLSGILGDVRSTADAVSTASLELQQAAGNISGGAQEQAASLEETTSTLENITSSVKHNADEVSQASAIAARSSDGAQQGITLAKDAIESMSGIQSSAAKIADIIGTIDGIAFQTNLLALNAAVEAARAGEQGRGFAVVATEVRSLATRSAEAAKEIHALIRDAVDRIGEGTAKVERVGQALEVIVNEAGRTNSLMSDIARNAREEADNIRQVSTAVSQMDQVTQSNAAQTEELAATAESLHAQANELQDLLGRFKLA